MFFYSLQLFFLQACSDYENIEVTPDTKEKEDTSKYNKEFLLTYNKKWTQSKIPSGLSNGTPQGAAYYDGNIYQFRYYMVGGVGRINYDTYNIETKNWKKIETPITCIPTIHAGSACFGPDITPSYTYRDSTYYCTKPFVFLTGHYSVDIFDKPICYEIIDVVDIENDNHMRRYTFPDKADDVIASYDFSNNKVWLIGYERNTDGMSPYVIEEYNVDLTSLHPDKTNFTKEDVVSSYTVGGPNRKGYQENLSCGTLQDAEYYNGYIYFSSGRGSSYDRTEWEKIHVYDIANHKIVDTVICPDYRETEGLIRYGNDLYITSLSGTLWKLSNGDTYDNKYNFEPANEVTTDSFDISNASQLVWFISQVYNGRSYIKGTLTADIDMSQVENPYTFYVYDTFIADGRGTDGRIFESHYAFRGSFDGQGHTISNMNISQTPYYNDGLFPYVVDATIKNVTVKGNIILTKADHGDIDDYQIRNVGFIGYMNGGTLENIDVQGITIDESKVINSKNISKLIGSENGKITKTNIKQ